MIQAARRILQNSFFNLVASVAQRIAQAVIFIVVARLLTASDIGAYKLANTYSSILLGLTFWGIDQLLIREIARRRDEASALLARFLGFRLLVTVLLFLILAATLPFLPYAPESRRLILVTALSLLPGAIASLYQAVWIALEDVRTISVLLALVSGVRMAGGLAILWLDQPLIWVAWWFLLVAVVEMVVNVIVTRRRFGLGPLRLELAPAAWWPLLRQALPLMVVSLALVIEYQFDVIVLSLFRPEEEVGVYGLASTLMTMLLFLIRSFELAIFPVIARAFRNGIDRLRRVYVATTLFALPAGFMVSLMVMLLSGLLIRLVYGPGNEPAAEIMRIMAWTFVISALNIPNSRVVIAVDRQVVITYFALSSLAGNLLFSLWLVPLYGGIGTAWAKLLSMPFYTIPCIVYVWWFLRRGYSIGNRSAVDQV